MDNYSSLVHELWSVYRECLFWSCRTNFQIFTFNKTTFFIQGFNNLLNLFSLLRIKFKCFSSWMSSFSNLGWSEMIAFIFFLWASLSITTIALPLPAFWIIICSFCNKKNLKLVIQFNLNYFWVCFFQNVSNVLMF